MIGCAFFQSFFYAFTHVTYNNGVCISFLSSFYKWVHTTNPLVLGFFLLPSFLPSSLHPSLPFFFPSFHLFLLFFFHFFPSLPPLLPSFLASSLSLFLSLLIKWMFINNYLDLLRVYKIICIQIIDTSVGSIHLPQVNYAVCWGLINHVVLQNFSFFSRRHR